MCNPFGSRSCRGIHKAAIGQRVFWLECVLKDGHDGRHYNSKRHFYWDELFYWDEFEWYGKETKAKPKRKKGWATTKDIHMKRGAKHDVMQQHREKEEWKFLEKQPATAAVVQHELALIDPNDPDAYYGSW